MDDMIGRDYIIGRIQLLVLFVDVNLWEPLVRASLEPEKFL